MTDRASQVLAEAMTLSEAERLDLAEQLMSSVPLDADWVAELERRARRAIADPQGGESWDVVKRRINVKVPIWSSETVPAAGGVPASLGASFTQRRRACATLEDSRAGP